MSDEASDAMTAKFDRWWADAGSDPFTPWFVKRFMRSIAKTAFLAGAAAERAERQRLTQRPPTCTLLQSVPDYSVYCAGNYTCGCTHD